MSTQQWFRAFAPATVANVAAAFDVLGFAVDAPGDEVRVRLSDRPGVRLLSIAGDNGELPLDPGENTATAAVIAMLSQLEVTVGVEVELIKNLPLCSGLGSSAASSAAAVVATNQALGKPLSRQELLRFAVDAEKVACGTAHADNAAPSLLGGFCMIRSSQPLDVVSLPVPPGLYCTLVHPHCEVRTEDARRVLRTHISLAQAVEQWGNVAGLVAGLCLADIDLVGRSLRDVVIEPTRSRLIPGFDEVKSAALAAGAIGCAISGSGPTLFALSTDGCRAAAIGEVMQAAFEEIGLHSDLFVSPISTRGARVLDQNGG